MVYEPLTQRLQLTQLGKKHFGGVVAQFYSPSVQRFVVNKAGGEIFDVDPLEKIKSDAHQLKKINDADVESLFDAGTSTHHQPQVSQGISASGWSRR